jgi:two-component system chemotaxis sensor kinase CheA
MFEELKKAFIEEVKELLQKTEKNLLLLENDRTNKEYVQEIFRSMHTIKGSAGVYGLDKTVHLAHQFESLFAKIRDGKLNADIQIISLALEAIDILLLLVQANSEDDIPNEKINSIERKLNNLKPSQQPDLQNVTKQQNTSKIASYYIVFEPNADIEERNIKIEPIISDFDEFQYKILTPLFDEKRIEQGKLEKFYEIIVASELALDDLKAIFLFTPNEFSIEKISDFNIFDDKNFVDFYENAVKILPFSAQRLELIKNYCKNIFIQPDDDTPEQNSEQNKNIQPHRYDDNTDTETNTKFDDLADLENISIGADELQQFVEESKDNNLQYIKVPAEELDKLLNLVNELIIANSQLIDSTQQKDLVTIARLSESIDKTINLIKENTLNLRLIPIKTILPPYYRIVRDLSLKLNKKIDFVTDGTETLVDKTIIDKLSVPLMHIIRNAIDHGIEEPDERIAKGKGETGIIRFIAYPSNSYVIIQIQDDGHGINPDEIKKIAIKKGFISPRSKLTKKEIYELLFLPGFTTSENITDISGRGVGMDAIKKAILDLRGDIEIDSELELGTSITIKLPLTLSIIETLHVSAGKTQFLLSMANISTCIDLQETNIKQHSGKRIILNDEIIPFIDISELFDLEKNENNRKLIVIKHGKQKFALIFDEIFGEYQAVIKNLGSIFNNLDFLLGVSILGNGNIAYILDTYKLLKRIQ